MHTPLLPTVRHKINVNSLLSEWYMVCLLLQLISHIPFLIFSFLPRCGIKTWNQNPLDPVQYCSSLVQKSRLYTWLHMMNIYTLLFTFFWYSKACGNKARNGPETGNGSKLRSKIFQPDHYDFQETKTECTHLAMQTRAGYKLMST